MRFKFPKIGAVDTARRRLLSAALAGGGLAALGGSRRTRAEEGLDELRFPGDPAEHKLLYQLNKADTDYHQHILFSVGAMLRKYGDNVQLVVVCFAEGIHVLAEHPERPVADEVKERIASLSQYGVEFHACGNTLKSLGWTEMDLVPFAKVVEVGAADIMELQEQGYAYLAW